MEIINHLSKLVSIPSSYPHEERMGEVIFTQLKKEGFTVTKQYIDTKRFNVLAEKGTGKKSILLYAHLDTVGVAEGWTTDPQKLTIIGDKAYGLGAWDMKAGLLANIFATEKAKLKNTKIKLVFCADEEYISKGGHMLISSSFMKDVVCVISTEPAFQYGVQGIVTGRIGRSVYDCEMSTHSQHFANYSPAFDVNIVYADFVTQLSKLYKKQGDKKQFVFVRSIESKIVGLSIPEKISFQLDSSVLPPSTHTSVLLVLKKIATSLEKKYKGKVSILVNSHVRETPFLEPYTIPSNNRYLKLLSKSIMAVTKKRSRPYFRSSVADENIFGSHGYTTLGIGPAGGSAHGANEWVSLSSIDTLTQILSHFISAADEL